MRSQLLLPPCFAALALVGSTANAAPTAEVAPTTTSEYGLEWKKNKQKIGTGAAKSERNSSPHAVYRPTEGATAVSGKLVVFLHGQGGSPQGYDAFLQTAADQGYFVIGLSYPMGKSISEACQGSSADNPKCPTRYREEVWSGAAESPLIDVHAHPQDSLHNRMHAVVHYLAAHPEVAGSGWNAFVDGDKLRWDTIVMAGHSLGAGYTAFVASKKKVPRAIMFAGPGDACDTGVCLGNANIKPLQHDIVSATWLQGKHATASDDYFSLVHTNDLKQVSATVPRVEKIRASVKLLGLPGDELTIDDLPLPQIRKVAPHKMLTSKAVWGSAEKAPAMQQDKSHGAVAGNVDLYGKTWIYMLTAPY